MLEESGIDWSVHPGIAVPGRQVDSANSVQDLPDVAKVCYTFYDEIRQINRQGYIGLCSENQRDIDYRREYVRQEANACGERNRSIWDDRLGGD